MHLAAFVEGVNHTTVWSDPSAGDQIALSTFAHIAEKAEEGLFDLLFLGQGLRLREHRGRLFELDVAGRPDSLTLYGALSALTSSIGLGATVNTTYTGPEQVAADFATLDHLSGGRSAWNIVTTNDAFTGENLRQGAYLSYENRYERARDVVLGAEARWSAAVHGGAYAYEGPFSAVRGTTDPDPLPQGRPVFIQAGGSPDGQAFAAQFADVVFSMHTRREAATAFDKSLRGHLRAAGRDRSTIRVLPIARIVLGDTPRDAQERAHELGLAQISPARALVFAEQVWGRSLQHVDPDGPLPDVDPVVPEAHLMQGRVQSKADPFATVAAWRARAESEGHTLRTLMIALYGRPAFVGTASGVADELLGYTDAGIVDGFAIGSYLMPGGWDEIVERLVPELQERDAYPRSYEGTTLREHLGLDPLGFHPSPQPTRPTGPSAQR